MKRTTALLFCFLLLLGCRQASERSSLDESPAASLPAVEESREPAAAVSSPSFEECGLPPVETLEGYRFWSDGEIYSHEQIAFEGEQTVLSAVNLAASLLPFVSEPLPILGVTMEKSFLTLDFSGEFISTYTKREVYEILNTVSMTLIQNGMADSFCFTQEGEIGMFGETWSMKPLAVAEGDVEEFAAIRAAIPYPGLNEIAYPSAEEIASRFGVTMDETAMEIARLLARVGKMERDAASPQELDSARIYLHCIWNTPYCSTEKGDAGYEPGLIPIADSVSAKLGMTETMFWLEEHVRETARLLCGDDFEISLAQGEDYLYRYFPLEGVVTPPHMGGGYHVVPLVLSYEETGSGYRAEVVYLFESMGGIGPWGTERTLTEQELPGFVAGEAERAEVLVRRADDGRLCFVGYRGAAAG